MHAWRAKAVTYMRGYAQECVSVHGIGLEGLLEELGVLLHLGGDRHVDVLITYIHNEPADDVRVHLLRVA